MNKQRRKQIDDIIKRIEEEFAPLIDSIRVDIERIREDEQEALDNMPQSQQDGEKGELAQSALDNLDEAIGLFESFDTDDIITSLNSAQE